MIMQKTPSAARELRETEEGAVMRLCSSVYGRQSGITMIEVLVTLVIVSVGLLGAAAMVINGLESNRNAYLRTQASILAYDMADRIRANVSQVDSYGGFSFDAGDELPTVPACYSSEGGCNAASMGNVDKAQWASALAMSDGGVILLPEAQGTIVQSGDEFVVTITWVQPQWNEGDGEIQNQGQNFVLSFNL
jgi:type IV pilus assembly protein PilV